MENFFVKHQILRLWTLLLWVQGVIYVSSSEYDGCVSSKVTVIYGTTGGDNISATKAARLLHDLPFEIDHIVSLTCGEFRTVTQPGRLDVSGNASSVQLTQFVDIMMKKDGIHTTEDLRACVQEANISKAFEQFTGSRFGDISNHSATSVKFGGFSSKDVCCGKEVCDTTHKMMIMDCVISVTYSGVGSVPLDEAERAVSELPAQLDQVISTNCHTPYSSQTTPGRLSMISADDELRLMQVVEVAMARSEKYSKDEFLRCLGFIDLGELHKYSLGLKLGDINNHTATDVELKSCRLKEEKTAVKPKSKVQAKNEYKVVLGITIPLVLCVLGAGLAYVWYKRVSSSGDKKLASFDISHTPARAGRETKSSIFHRKRWGSKYEISTPDASTDISTEHGQENNCEDNLETHF